MQRVFDKYINYLEAERNASPYTIRNYTADLLEFFSFLRQKKVKSLKDVDRHVLRNYLSYLIEQGFKKAIVQQNIEDRIAELEKGFQRIQEMERTTHAAYKRLNELRKENPKTAYEIWSKEYPSDYKALTNYADELKRSQENKSS